METNPPAAWADSLDHEIGFWRRRISGDPEAFQRRYERPSPTNELLPGLVELVGAERPSLLDVGSGPAPVVIGRYSKPVDISACDPLAGDYQRLLEESHVKLPLKLSAVAGERLVEHFGLDRFDITHIQNALDHSYRPVEVLKNMLGCTKPGGVVLIRSVINEGFNQHYHGLHQWDLSPGTGDFYIRDKEGTRTSMRQVLADDLDLLLVGAHVSSYGGKLQHWMDVVLVKKGAASEFLEAVDGHFWATQIELGRSLIVEWQKRDKERKGLRTQLDRAREQQAALEGSTSFQLSKAFVRAGKSPIRIALLPKEMVRLFRATKQSGTKQLEAVN